MLFVCLFVYCLSVCVLCLFICWLVYLFVCLFGYLACLCIYFLVCSMCMGDTTAIEHPILKEQ